MNPVFLPWLVAVGLISADDIIKAHHLPIPSRFLASFLIFGLLGLFADTRVRPLAVTVAVGLDVAMFLNYASVDAGTFSKVGGYLAQTGATSTGKTLGSSSTSPSGQSVTTTFSVPH